MAECGLWWLFHVLSVPTSIKRGRVCMMTEIILSLVAVCMLWFFAYTMHFLITVVTQDEEE